MRVRLPAGWALMVLALSGCGTAGSDPGPALGEKASVAQEAPTAASTAASTALPNGWRWESYDRLQVGVPGDWGYGTTDRPWCGRSEGETAFVGRPGAVRDIGCRLPGAEGPDPATELEPGGTFVWFSSPAKQAQPRPVTPGTLADPAHDGDRESVVAGGVQLAVQAPESLRRQILATVRVVDDDGHDQNGCSVVSPVAADAGWRPDGPPVGELTDVQKVSACEYSAGRLTSSLRLAGQPAAEAIAAVAQAPVGGGPNSPAGDCLPDDLTLVEHIIVQVASASGESQIVVRYGGCFHRGLDDGTTLRTLTRPAVGPFVAGPNRVTGWNGEALAGILRP